MSDYLVNVLVSKVMIVHVEAEDEAGAIALAEEQARADFDATDLEYEAYENTARLATDDDEKIITI